MICPWFPNGFCVHFHLFHIITGHHKPKKKHIWDFRSPTSSRTWILARIWTMPLPRHLEIPRVYLVGGIPTPLKNMKVSWDHYSQYMEK
jgi:hypothetical protein